MRLRKNQSDAIDGTAGEAGAAKRRRREGRGWGPFSGGQLTIIIVTFALLLLFPIGAWALTFSNVAITDPGGVNQAKVNAFGQLSVTAAGSVTATQTPPNASWTETFTGFETAGICSTVSSPVPAGKALVVTSITVYVESVTAATATVSVHAATPGSPCTSRLSADYVGAIARGESKVIPFTSGFPVKPGRVIGLTIGSTSGNAVALVTTHGYLVSSTLCTVTGPPAGCH
ncbi:MAG: hypothetical protein M3Q30_15450 [Actinomycetota bacterium]|nr:hypothetical protein [Actinomycetota bacterium]